jgi:hypothetical protein
MGQALSTVVSNGGARAITPSIVGRRDFVLFGVLLARHVNILLASYVEERRWVGRRFVLLSVH